jgi:hypothetical protein
VKKKTIEPVKKAVVKSTGSKSNKVVKAALSKPTVAKAKAVKKKKHSTKSYTKGPGRCLMCGGFYPSLSSHMDSDHDGDNDSGGDNADAPSGGGAAVGGMGS